MQHLKLLAALAVGIVALLVPSGVAMGATAPGYEEFSDCPDRAVNSAITLCAITTVTDGHLQMGSKDTPFQEDITLVTGMTAEQEAIQPTFDGGRHMIPGGLTGITGLDWLSWLFPFSLLTLHAEPELAGDVTNPLGPIGLPLKVRLDSPLLNNHCFIGSDSNPISLTLTYETTDPPPPNEPISGQQGTLAPDPNLPGVFRSTGIILVDNEFAAPGASGCDLIGFGLINALVNLQAGLPSPAGTNETIQEAVGAFAPIHVIYPPVGIEQ